MYGLTRQSYKAFKKAHKPPQKVKQFNAGGLAGMPANKAFVQTTERHFENLQEQEKQKAQNAFNLFYNFNNRNKV